MSNETAEPNAVNPPSVAEMLWNATERLRALEEAAPVAIVALDRDRRVVMWNTGAERLFGWRASEIIGRPCPLVPDDQQAEYFALHERVLRGEALSGIESRRKRKDGSEVVIDLSAASLRDAGGNVCGTLSVLTDVTEHKRLEQQFLQAQKMEAIGQLAGGIAHDFNNLLMAVLGYSELVLDRVQDRPDVEADIKEIKRAGERASRLTRQLLAFSRKQLLTPQVLDLNHVVRDLQQMLTRVIGDDIRLNMVTASPLGHVKADPGQIEQVLMNLAVNARDAMPQGGTLTIETADAVLDEAFVRQYVGAEPGRYVSLVVRDTGCGMTPDVLARLFEPFFTTKGPAGGTGLGLSTVYGIIKQSGGFIAVNSTPGLGTTFAIYLPQVDEPIESAVSPPSVSTLHGTETILLVEDDGDVRELIRKMLERYGYSVLEARDAADALRIEETQRGPIDLLVSDLIMPGLRGPDLAQRLVRRRPAIKVLYVSGYANQVALERGSISARASLLQKPFTSRTLATKVRESLDAPLRPPAPDRGRSES